MIESWSKLLDRKSPDWELFQDCNWLRNDFEIDCQENWSRLRSGKMEGLMEVVGVSRLSSSSYKVEYLSVMWKDIIDIYNATSF